MLLERLSPRPLVAVCFLAGLTFQLLLGASYLGAFVDPMATTDGVPVAFVNLDEGSRGDELADRLRDSEAPVEWVPVDTRDAALEGLRTKAYVGALILPANFSAALGSFMTPEPHAATAEVVLSPGSTRTGSLVAEGVLDVALDRLRARVQERALAAAEAHGGLGVLTLDQARFLANPLHVERATVNPVPPATGNGMAPVYIAMSAWVGGYFGAVALEKFQGQHRLSPRRRALLLPVVGLAQGALTVGALRMVGLSIADPLALTLAVAAGTWMAYAVVALLLDVAGLAGVVPAFAIMALGIPASGGIYPAEMLPAFWRALHDVSPFTWMVETLRTLLYTPAAGDLASQGTRILGLGLAATGLSLVRDGVLRRRA